MLIRQTTEHMYIGRYIFMKVIINRVHGLHALIVMFFLGILLINCHCR